MTAQAVRLTSTDIDNALKNQHFDVIFQPIFRLQDGGLERVEAFVRWVHPGLGTLPPGAFISFFENQGRMSELTRYVIRSALTAYTGWRGTDGPGLSVNLAFSDITDKTFPAWLTTLLEEFEFPPHLLTLECPALPANIPASDAQVVFAALRDTGVHLAIEVRGRANETLTQMSPFPFHEVKTGGSAILRFARTVRGGPGLTAISELLELAKSNDAAITAVGVEDQASLQALANLGFSAAQGNYLSGVTELSDLALGAMNEVRRSLSLDELSDEALGHLITEETGSSTTSSGLSAPLPENQAEHNATNAPDTEDMASADPDFAKEDAAARASAEEADRKAAEEAALKRQKAARLAAKKRALKKAADAKRAAEKAAKELEEARAAKKAEENAKKLQDRLTKAFDVEEAQESTEAGLLLGGSLATAALKQEPVLTAGSDDSPVPLTTAQHPDDNPAPVDTGDTTRPAEDTAEAVEEAPEQALDGSGDLTIEGEETLPDDLAAALDNTPGVNADPEETADAEDLFETEDDILDRALDGAPVLDPTNSADAAERAETLDTQTEHPDKDFLVIDTAEQALASRLIREKRRRKPKNFLTRKYKLRVTHFWPRSWKRAWEAEKAANEDLL